MAGPAAVGRTRRGNLSRVRQQPSPYTRSHPFLPLNLPLPIETPRLHRFRRMMHKHACDRARDFHNDAVRRERQEHSGSPSTRGVKAGISTTLPARHPW